MVDSPYAGLTPAMQKQVEALVMASHGQVYLKSGYRTTAHQQSAWDQAVKQYGPDNAAQWVAPPDASNHVQGLAADLGGNMQVAAQLAPQFGLVAPMPWEPWHFEFPSTAQTSNPNAYTTPPPGEQNPTQAVRNQDPSHVAATLAESLMALRQHDVLGQIVATAPEQTTAPAGTPAGTQPVAGGQGPAPNYAPGGGAFGGVNQVTWAHDFLTKTGMPITSENMRAIEAWQLAESGGGGGHFNPLNTTQGGYAGESNLNSVGVKNYITYDDGIQANAKVLFNGRYQPIIDALKQGNNAMAVAQAIAQSPWGSGTLVEKVLSGG